MTDASPDSETRRQLRALGYLDNTPLHTRPLLICDVDEVVLHLIDPFEKVLAERGFELQSLSFKLTGNIFDVKSGREATKEEVWAGLAQLFEEQADRQGIVTGVIDALTSLSNSIDIVFLTNMPHQFGDVRRNYLTDNGLNFPLITNTASKVPAMQTILNTCSNTVGFIDDTPKNLEQVRKGLPDIKLFHFVATEKFRELAGNISGTQVSSSNWAETTPVIRSVLNDGA